MRTGIAVLAIACFLIASSGAGSRQDTAKESSACAVVQQAIKDFEQVKAGMTRREVEKYFVPEGGGQFREGTRYVYPKCEYIKLKIEFSLDPSVNPTVFSPHDTVTKVGKLYLEYPIKD